MPTAPELIPLQKNLALKRLFSNRGLDLEAVMEFTPYDLDLENQRLLALAEFVMAYDQYGSREMMEIEQGGWVYPPIFPGISPDSDWSRFELWLNGEAIQKPLGEMLADQPPFRQPSEIGDEEIDVELERLIQAIKKADVGIGLQEGLPSRLLYSYLHDNLDELFDMGGGWVIDGCSGYCPGCVQRPWCDTGHAMLWSEDKEAGKMHLPPELEPYVSASPQSLDLLQKADAAEKAARSESSDEELESYLGFNPNDDEVAPYN